MTKLLSHFNNGQIDLWYASVDKHKRDITTYIQCLNDSEMEKAENLKSIKERNNYIISLAILKKLLGYYLAKDPSDIVFSYTKYHKPYLKNCELKFNLSHSGNILLLGFSLNQEIGVDVEQIEYFPEVDDVAKNFFSMNEYFSFCRLSPTNKIEGFYNCWTRKEAFIKAIGSGLHYSLKEFEVTLIPGKEVQLVKIKNSEDEGRNWSLFSFELLPNYKAAAAVRLKECRMSVSKYTGHLVA